MTNLEVDNPTAWRPATPEDLQRTGLHNEHGRDGDSSPRGGRSRKDRVGKPKPKDQENFTDPESRIMKDGSGAFQQCYDAEIAVDGHERIIVAASVLGKSWQTPETPRRRT